MAGNFRIPKRVGAVKLPKKVRKKARKAIKAATNPFVRDFATAAMAAAGRARRDGGGADGSDRGNSREEHGMRHETRINIDASKVAEAFRAAAVDGFRRFLEGLEEGLKKARTGDKDDPQPEPQAKPKAKSKAATKPKTKAAAKPKPRKAHPGAAKPAPRGPAA